MSTRAQYAHGRKNEKFHSAQEASELKLKRLEQCWGKYQENLWSEAVQLNRFMLKLCCVSSQNFAWLKMIEFIKLLSKIHTPFLISFPEAVPAQGKEHY